MRPRRARVWDRLIASMTVGALGAAGVLFASEAKADVLSNYIADNAYLVCAFLDDYLAQEGIEPEVI